MPDHPAREQFRALYRLSSLLWLLLALSLGLYAHGSTLTERYSLLRNLVPALAALVALAMLARLLVPGRPRWTRWALPLMIGLCVTTCALSAFGAAGLGVTAPRLGVTGLIGVVAAFGTMHYWAADRVTEVRPAPGRQA